MEKVLIPSGAVFFIVFLVLLVLALVVVVVVVVVSPACQSHDDDDDDVALCSVLSSGSSGASWDFGQDHVVVGEEMALPQRRRREAPLHYSRAGSESGNNRGWLSATCRRQSCLLGELSGVQVFFATTFFTLHWPRCLPRYPLITKVVVQ